MVRVSGDEFVFLCENLGDPGDAHLLVRRIADALEEPFELPGVELSVTASVGVAIAHHDETISDRLLAVAERTDLINEVGAWVLRRSCADHHDWRASHRGLALDLALNVSVRQLLAPGFVDTVASVLAATGTPPAVLIPEVTESVLMDDARRTQLVLDELRETGIRIDLDDFGTGFSSLSNLRQLPIDIVKIDRSFVADVDVPLGGGSILAAVTNLAHVLDLPVTAEGVETRRQHDEVRGLGCELAQGFFYAHPMSATRIERLLGQNGDGTRHLPTSTGASSVRVEAPAPSAR